MSSPLTYNGQDYDAAQLRHVLDVANAAIHLAPLCSSGIDWSGNPFQRPGDESDEERVSKRAFALAEAFIAKKEAMIDKLPKAAQVTEEKEADHA